MDARKMRLLLRGFHRYESGLVLLSRLKYIFVHAEERLPARHDLPLSRSREQWRHLHAPRDDVGSQLLFQRMSHGLAAGWAELLSSVYEWYGNSICGSD